MTIPSVKIIWRDDRSKRNDFKNISYIRVDKYSLPYRVEPSWLELTARRRNNFTCFPFDVLTSFNFPGLLISFLRVSQTSHFSRISDIWIMNHYDSVIRVSVFTCSLFFHFVSDYPYAGTANFRCWSEKNRQGVLLFEVWSVIGWTDANAMWTSDVQKLCSTSYKVICHYIV
jgi:hypothetical protein